jgi:general L-amino acid transport system permease protein
MSQAAGPLALTAPAAPGTGAPSGPPLGSTGVFGWIRANLFHSWLSAAVTIGLVYLIAHGAYALFQWAVVNAVWTVESGPSGPNTEACRAIEGIGACWAVIAEKHRFILFGTYPFEEHWRPALCVAIFIGLYVASASRQLSYAQFAAAWTVSLLAIGVLMWGGTLGLPFVPQERWGGLVVTLILATFGLALAFPLAILVALGRRSRLPAIRILCVLYVELIRGVPLISLLFMSSVILPLFLPEGLNIDKLLRAQIAFILFAAAYLAEVIRGGLQAVPKGQYEAADALGLTYWRKMGLIILPQALRTVIPPLVNTFIGFFKDTSLVLIIGIFDLLSAGKTAILEPAWQGFGIEVYVFCGLIYFAFCFAMSRYSQRLEAELGGSRPR